MVRRCTEAGEDDAVQLFVVSVSRVRCFEKVVVGMSGMF